MVLAVLAAAVAGIALVAVLAGIGGAGAPPSVQVELPVAAPSEATAEPEVNSRVRDAALIEEGAYGPLPRVAADGGMPRLAYALPFDNRDDRPRIVIIVDDLGLNRAASDAAIRRLAPATTLALTPYAEDPGAWAGKARAAGHEVLLVLPSEPTTFPYRDPGPRALLTSLSPEDNQDRLAWLLSRFTGYVGVVDQIGDAFHADEAALVPVMGELGRRGLLFVDGVDRLHSAVGKAAVAAHVPLLTIDRRIDETPTREAIDGALADLEAIAGRRAAAVGLARPLPVTIDRLAAWADQLESRGFVLAPVTAVAGRQIRP